jgi:hypothetical protein
MRIIRRVFPILSTTTVSMISDSTKRFYVEIHNMEEDEQYDVWVKIKREYTVAMPIDSLVVSANENSKRT